MILTIHRLGRCLFLAWPVNGGNPVLPENRKLERMAVSRGEMIELEEAIW
jgi:hypothetical protein